MIDDVKHTPTLTVGIPAYNEGKNIGSLIKQVIGQSQTGYVLEKVLVISDGSGDNTVEEVTKINDKRIELIAHADRKGKAARFQELLSRANSDALIQFDADVRLASPNVLSLLAQAIANGADLAFPLVWPLTPRTFVEQMSYFGFDAWQRVLKRMPKEKTHIHRCQGRCRIFSKNFYKSFKLPINADGVEDIYSFCYAITNNFRTNYVSGARVEFRLPANSGDFLKQSRRFIKGGDSLAQFYDKALVDTFVPSYRLKMLALLETIFSYLPHISIGYILFQLYAHKTATMEHQKPKYEYVGSTKEL